MLRDLMQLVEDLKEMGLLRKRKGLIAKRIGLEKYFDRPLRNECIADVREYLFLWASRYLVSECQRMAIKAIKNVTNKGLTNGQKGQVIDIFCQVFNKLYPFHKEGKEDA